MTHYLRELPAFFRRVAKIHALEHLKVVIAHEDGGMLEAEDEKEGVQHSASSLAIEGRWSELFPAINLCTPPLAANQSQTLCLYYYLLDLPHTQMGVAQLLDLPARIIPPDHLETLKIKLLDDLNPYLFHLGQELVLMVDAFRPLLRYRRMVTLHLDLPCNILLDIEFLNALAGVMEGTLRHLVVLRAKSHWDGKHTSPVLTVDDLPTIAGVILPRLETLGLDVTWDEEPPSVKRHSLVVSSLLRTLHVGTRHPSSRNYGQVAKFLKRHFPGLQYLYFMSMNDGSTPWIRVKDANRYSGGWHKEVEWW